MVNCSGKSPHTLSRAPLAFAAALPQLSGPQRQKTHHGSTQNKKSGIDPAAEQGGKDRHGGCSCNPTCDGPLGHSQAPSKKQTDGDRCQPTLDRSSPGPFFEPGP